MKSRGNHFFRIWIISFLLFTGCVCFNTLIRAGLYEFDTGNRITQTTVPDRQSPRCIAVGPSRLLLVWRESQYLVASQSRDEGFSWSAPVRINESPEQVSPWYSVATDHNGIVAVLWRNPEGTRIISAISEDGGATWTPEIPVNANDIYFVGEVSVAVSDSRIVAIRLERASPEAPLRIYASYYDMSDGGWSESAVRVDDYNDPIVRSDVYIKALTGGGFLAAWSDGRGTLSRDIYVSRSTDGGITWSPNMPLDPGFSGDDRYPTAIETAAGDIVLGFTHWYSFYYGYTALLISPDSGISWSLLSNEPPQDNNASFTRSSHLCVSQTGDLAVLWSDERRYDDVTMDGMDVYFSVSSRPGETWDLPNTRINGNTTGENLFYFAGSIADLPGGDLLVFYKEQLNEDHHCVARGYRAPTVTPTAPPGFPTYTPPPPTPTRTPTPLISPTVWPTLTPTPDPQATATPPCTHLEMKLTLNDTWLSAGDRFLLECRTCSPDTPRPMDQYIILDIFGAYWFWDSWSQTVNYRRVNFSSQIVTETILDFVWPVAGGSLDGIILWGAYLEPDVNILISNVTHVEFGYGPP